MCTLIIVLALDQWSGVRFRSFCTLVSEGSSDEMVRKCSLYGSVRVQFEGIFSYVEAAVSGGINSYCQSGSNFQSCCGVSGGARMNPNQKKSFCNSSDILKGGEPYYPKQVPVFALLQYNHRRGSKSHDDLMKFEENPRVLLATLLHCRVYRSAYGSSFN